MGWWLLVAGISGGGALLGFLIALFVVNLQRTRPPKRAGLARRLAATPHLPRDFVHGARGWLEGVARGEPSRVSPVSGTPCFAYRVEVEEKQPNPAAGSPYEDAYDRMYGDEEERRRGSRRVRRAEPFRHWVSIHLETHAEPFVLQTPSASIRVELDSQSELDLDREREVQRGIFSSLPPEVSARLEGLGIASSGRLRDRPLRIREQRLDPGEACTVIGELRSVAASAAYRDAATEWTLVGGADWLVVHDRPFADASRPPRLPARKVLWLLPLALGLLPGAVLTLVFLLAR